MDKSVINTRILPYDADYALLEKWRLIDNILLVIVSILSVVNPFILNNSKTNVNLNNVVDYASYIVIISYYIIDIVTDVFFYSAASRLRRMSLLDNSLGTKILNSESKNYFTNDSLKPGLYKLSVNCYENCFFTYNIAKGMTTSVIIKNVIFSGVFITIAYIGFRGNVVALPIMQILLSTLFITELIHHLAFISRLRILLEKFELHFNDTLKSKSKRNNPQHPILMLLEYETTLAYNKAPLSNRVYEKLKLELSEKWEDIKKHYEID